MTDELGFLGSWRLESAHVVEGDTVIDRTPFGAEPHGLLHYLSGGRMAVLIAHGGRIPFANGRLGATDAETPLAARTFTAYAGRFEVEGDHITHHVEMNRYPNGVGVGYRRVARIDGDVLELTTPSGLPPGQRPMRLCWRRIGR